ncbi:MAG TPA: APC family permease [Caulobacteraceae bacterium]
MRRLGALLLTVSGITPAASVFVIGSAVIAQAGTGALVAFLAAAAICVPVALAYAELSSAFPVTGAEYTFLGRALGPAWGFMALGLNVVGGALSQAVTALGLAAYLSVAVPGLPTLPAALVAVGISTVIAVLNVRTNALVTGLFLAAELLALAAVTSLGLWHEHRSVAQAIIHPVVATAAGRLSPTSLTAIGLGTAGAIFAYNGFGGAVSFGEELKEARRSIASVILVALVVAVICEAIPMIAIIVGAPDLASILAASSPTSAFISAGGPWFSKAVSLGVALAIVNAMIALTLMNARYLYATARDQAWPAALNRAFGATHPRFRSPHIATVVMGALSAVACLLSLRLLVVLTATGIVFIYIGVIVAALLGRRTGSTAQGAYKAPWHPWALVAGLVALAGVVVADIADPEVGRLGLAANVAVSVAFAGYYWLFVRRRGVWRLTGAEGPLTSSPPEQGAVP